MSIQHANLDHGSQLDGLADDDHTQYHNDARGDARYYTQAQVNGKFGGTTGTIQKDNGTSLTDSVIEESSGDIGISVSPTHRLHVKEDASGGAVLVHNDGNSYNRHGIYVWCGPDVLAGDHWAMIVDSGAGGNRQGGIKGSNGTMSFWSASDRALKHGIGEAGRGQIVSTGRGRKASELLADLQVSEFCRIGNDIKQIGYIAQDAEAVYPEMVSLGPDGKTHGVTTISLIPVLHLAIQEHHETIQRQQDQIDSLTERLATLEAKLEAKT